MLAAGKLRHRVTLQSKGTPTRDAMGGEVVTWTTVDTVWAEVRPLSGRALIAAKQAKSEVTASITLRHRDDISPDWRVVHGSDTYDVHAIIQDGAGISLNLQCSKGMKHG
jgi:SPP1 family predicted phage head-tail adaptor